MKQVAAQSLHLFVLGIHGDSQVVPWSKATLGSMPLHEVFPQDSEVINHVQLERDCKHRSQEIVRAKGSTPFGVSAVVASLCTSIIFDKCNVRPVSHLQSKFECCFSMPAVIGRKGIIRTLNLPLSRDEETRIMQTAAALKSNVGRVREMK
jgi:L-lactate dehydrogenase